MGGNIVECLYSRCGCAESDKNSQKAYDFRAEMIFTAYRLNF